MSQPTIVAIMIHVSSVPDALVWYARAFPSAVRRVFPGSHFEYLAVGDIQLEFVPADSKVSSGPSGTVAYWSVAQFEQALAHLRSVGATLYRGPLAIANGQSMCQVQDPWGNCIGLRGPSRASAAA